MDHRPPALVTEPDEQQRIDRRTAMRAALGGASAAAVFVAPRIEGFSLSPDYAAAASCTDTSGNLTFNTEKPGGCAVICWGTKNGNTSGGCGGLCANGCCSDETQNLQLPGTNFNLRFDMGGTAACAGCTDNAGYRYAINGIDPPFQSCTLNYGISNDCNKPAPTVANNNVALTNWVNTFTCNSANTNRSLTVTFACECN